MGKKDDKEIRVKEYSSGNGAKIDLYSPSAKKDPHDSIHIKVDTEKKSFETITKIDGQKETGSGSCYLTSACMRHLQEEFDDDCHELFILRWFRDTFVTKSEINYYYEIAPRIVEQIEQADNCEEIYEYIYKNIIMPCVKAIEFGDFKFAYNRYKSSILCLEEEFVCKENENVKTLLPNI